MSLRLRFAELMSEVAAHDEKLVVLVSDISHGILQPFAKSFPNRYFNVGICEPSIVNMASGLSHVGLRPVVHTIAPFLIERSFEQLKLDFGYQERSVNLVSVGGAFDYSQLGCSHHSYSDAALISQIPGSRVFMPASISELDRLFRAAYEMPGINYFRLTENPHSQDLQGWGGKVGEGVRLRDGQDVTIATVGARLTDAAAAAEKLAVSGIEVDLLYFPTLEPFDSQLLRGSAAKTRRVLTVEELLNKGGLYTRTVEVCVGLENLQVKPLAISGFIHEYGTYDELCRVAGLDTESIVESAKALIND